MTTRAPLLLLLGLSACTGKDESAPDEESDSDTDADADADADTDADTDTGPPPLYPPVTVTGLTGTITLTTMLDGVPRCDLELALAFDPTGARDTRHSWSAPVVSTVVRNDGKTECEKKAVVPDEEYMTVRTFDPKVDVGLSYKPAEGGEKGEVMLLSYKLTPPDTTTAIVLAHGKNYFHYADDNLLEVDETWPPSVLTWNSDVTIELEDASYRISTVGSVEATWEEK